MLYLYCAGDGHNDGAASSTLFGCHYFFGADALN